MSLGELNESEPNDIDPQTQGNYSYDPIGNLTKDDAEGISAITWLPNNKIGTITKTNGMVIQFTYDASGQRITKKVEKIVQGVRITEIEFYLRDASGTVMANYILHPDSCTLLLKEQPIYGSTRLGVYAPNKDVTSNTVPSIGAQNAQQFTLIRGQRLYELSNWLGNVQVVITDKKLAICGSAQTPAYYEADIQSAQDYYPFGSLMPGRNFNSAGYKYGMNGQEKTDEIAGAGNHTTAEFWEYDTRLGRRWNLDPKPNPWESQYSVMGGNPIWRTDILGDKWKTKSDEAKAKDLNSSLESRKNQLNKQADKFTARADKLAAKGKEEKANSLRAKAEEARAGATELGKAQTELTEIGTNATEFTFSEKTGSNISYTYMDAGGTVVIEFGSDANAIHELTHAYQHISGQVELVAGTGGGYYVDATDEQQAYSRQYFFSPFSVTMLNSDVAIRISTSKDITTDFVLKIWITDASGAKVYPYSGLGTTPVNKPGSPADTK